MAANALARDEVHQALEALYDNVALSGAALLRHFPQLGDVARLDERAERARAMILEAIEVLRPARSVPFGSAESRGYDVLSLRYVENQPLPQVGQELSLSRRQLYRDLALAEEKLAQVLSSWTAAPAAAEPGRRQDLLSDELTALTSQPRPVALQAMLDEAVELVQPLAAQLRVPLERGLPPEAVSTLVLVDGALFKQVLVQVLSGGLQSTPDAIRLSLSVEEHTCLLTIAFRPGAGGFDHERIEQARRIAASQDVSCRLERAADGAVTVTLLLRRGETRTVLVVEDNPGAVELYRRYLSSGNWSIAAVANPRLAVDMAKRARPDVIVLDIIMPGVDGWSVIKALRAAEETSSIPLVICSVLEDPRLVQTMGVSAYLTKPVSRAQLLSALTLCLRPPGGAAG